MVCKEIGAVSIIRSTPEKENLNTASFATAGNGYNISIANRWEIDVLIGLNAGKGSYPIAPDGGAFKI